MIAQGGARFSLSRLLDCVPLANQGDARDVERKA